MFWRCVAKISIDKDIKNVKKGAFASKIIPPKKGAVKKQTRADRADILNIINVIAQIAIIHRNKAGDKTRIVPSAVATPLPPLMKLFENNRSHKEKT